MRIQLIFTGLDIIPYNYQYQIMGTIMGWLGNGNNIHSKTSLYSFGRLDSYFEATKEGLICKSKFATLNISAYSESLINKLIEGVTKNPAAFMGAPVVEINPIAFEERDSYLFFAENPILLKNAENQHVLFYEETSEKLLFNSLERKIKMAGLESEKFSLQFSNRHSKNAKTKLIEIKGVKMRGSLCPIIFQGSNKIAKFLWEVGAGNNTGMGFGSLIQSA